jgi:hypothetical protein
MTDERPRRQDDYVIFRTGGMEHFRPGDTPPQYVLLATLAVLCTGAGLVLMHLVISSEIYLDTWGWVLAVLLLLLGLLSLVATLAVGAVLKAVGAVLYKIEADAAWSSGQERRAEGGHSGASEPSGR